MTFGSLFAGIGGFDLGLERAGMVCQWQVEIDPFCRQVLAKHWPHVRRYEDIRDVDGRTLEAVDLLCGGFPCQPHSLAGKRGGSTDTRDLWGEFARLIRETRPRWVLAENVPGLLSTESGRFFGRVLRDLAACGYDAEWDCIPASAVGAPHRRDRVWLVAYPNRERLMWRQPSPEATLAAQGCPTPRTGATVADPDQPGPQGRHGAELSERAGQCAAGTGGASVADAQSGVRQWETSRVFGYAPLSDQVSASQWESEPDVGRVAHGVPARVDRLRSLGNSIVPQVAQWLGQQIMEAR